MNIGSQVEPTETQANPFICLLLESFCTNLFVKPMVISFITRVEYRIFLVRDYTKLRGLSSIKTT